MLQRGGGWQQSAQWQARCEDLQQAAKTREEAIKRLIFVVHMSGDVQLKFGRQADLPLNRE